MSPKMWATFVRRIVTQKLQKSAKSGHTGCVEWIFFKSSSWTKNFFISLMPAWQGTPRPASWPSSVSCGPRTRSLTSWTSEHHHACDAIKHALVFYSPTSSSRRRRHSTAARSSSSNNGVNSWLPNETFPSSHVREWPECNFANRRKDFLHLFRSLPLSLSPLSLSLTPCLIKECTKN